MRIFFVAILSFASLITIAKAYGQSVTIPAPVAEYFLEQNDKAILLEKKDSINTLLVSDLNHKIVVKDSIISTYENDKKTFEQVLQVKQEENKIYQEELRIAKKEIRKQKILKVIGYIGAGVITVLSLL